MGTGKYPVYFIEKIAMWDRECGTDSFDLEKSITTFLFYIKSLSPSMTLYDVCMEQSLLILLGNLDLKSSFILK